MDIIPVFEAGIPGSSPGEGITRNSNITDYMKKRILITFLGISLLFIANYALATTGLVPPCGGPGQSACGICDVFKIINNVLRFIFLDIVPPTAVLMVVIGGVTFMTAAGEPSKVALGKKIITTVVIGLVIVYGSWLILGLFLRTIGLNEWTLNIYKNWWELGTFHIPGCP